MYNYNYENENAEIILDKSFIIAAILNVKTKYFNEEFVTFNELSYITSAYQEMFNDYNLNVIISNNIDKNIFNVSNSITLNSSKYLTMTTLKIHYQRRMPFVILKILWDEEILAEELIAYKTKNKNKSYKLSR